MSLTDKVIKNTFYHLLSQGVTFIVPFILTPFILSAVGETQFGIYILSLGVQGLVSLLDLGLATSFVRFISEFYNKKKFSDLNKLVNTYIVFYFIFLVVLILLSIFFIPLLIDFFDIPPQYSELAYFLFLINIIIFLVSNLFTIFNSVIVAIQKNYLLSLAGIAFALVNFALSLTVLYMGYGLKGIIIVQFGLSIIFSFITMYLAFKNLPELKFIPSNIDVSSFKKMTKFGIQMQVSKISTFFTEKYDEFLLAHFSTLGNITLFNLGARIAKLGRFIPAQIIGQVAPAAAELKFRATQEKLNELFTSVTRYLTIFAIPVFTFIIVFSDLIIFTWLGKSYPVSANIVRILSAGYLLNLLISAPGNSITPNIGLPKIQMVEGIINLLFNLVISFILIKNYGIFGAAIGITIASVASSLYVLLKSVKLFGTSIFTIIKRDFIKPVISALVAIGITYLGYWFVEQNLLKVDSIFIGIISLLVYVSVFLVIYSGLLTGSMYFSAKDKEVIRIILFKVFPLTYFIKKRRDKLIKKSGSIKHYEGELVSITIVTHNRLNMLKECIGAIIATLKSINYELIIWDNNSSDGTKDFLKRLEGNTKNVKVIYNDENIGVNAKANVIEMAKGDFIIFLDDDVIQFPDRWIQEMIYAYKNIPNMGYLSTDVVQNEHTTGAKLDDSHYFNDYYDDKKIKLQVGPAGGWCFIISREVYNKVGKFIQFNDRVFFAEDGDYTFRVIKNGYKRGILGGLKVFHATGPYYNREYKEIFDNKQSDHKRGYPASYALKQKIQNYINFKYIYYKIIEFGERELSNSIDKDEAKDGT